MLAVSSPSNKTITYSTVMQSNNVTAMPDTAVLSTSIGILKPVSIFKKHRYRNISTRNMYLQVLAQTLTLMSSSLCMVWANCHVDTLCPCIVGDKIRASSESIGFTVSSVLDISDWQIVPLWFHTF